MFTGRQRHRGESSDGRTMDGFASRDHIIVKHDITISSQTNMV